MTVETWDFHGLDDVEFLDSVRHFVKLSGIPWRQTKTGLLRWDRPEELTFLVEMIENRFHTKVHDWWVMKQEPGSPGTMPHIHNKWDTYVYYTDWSNAHIVGADFDIMPGPGRIVYLPEGTEHAVERSHAEEGDNRYSVVFLAPSKARRKGDPSAEGPQA